MSNENETQAEALKSPAEWCHIEQVAILDADGWRGRDGRDFTDAISLAEFRSRLATCTQRNLALPAGEHHTPIDDWPEIEGAFDEVLERAAQARLGDGEHHTGTLNLTGEGNAPASPISDELAIQANGIFWSNYGTEQSFVVPDDGSRAMRLALEAAYPAIRQQVADEIAAECERRSKIADRDTDRRSGVREGMVVTWLMAEKVARGIGGAE